MASENETVEEVKRRMLKWADEDIHEVGRDVLRRQAQQFASDLESAWRREKAELVECLKNTMVAMCNYCRSTPEAKGLPCLNGCATMLAAKRLIEVAEGGES